jgi:cytochrome c oxidase subunit 3
MACAILLTTLGAVVYFHYSQLFLVLLGLFSIALCMFLWLKDVVRESTFQGHHTKIAIFGLKLGFLLFIVSEVLFFFSFFWAFFHSSLSPSVEIGVM